MEGERLQLGTSELFLGVETSIGERPKEKLCFSRNFQFPNKIDQRKINFRKVDGRKLA